MNIAVAVSGGVDSLCALLRLRQAGHTVFALHGRFLPVPPERDPVPALARACALLQVPLHVADLRAAFDAHVVAPFVQAYAAGRTPNPCALCNAGIKFGLLLDAARAHGAAKLATGHYAALREHPRYHRALCRSDDALKDQSYFLALVPHERLLAAHFPLARMHKEQTRAAVAAAGLTVPLPAESQEICFVPQDAYRPFVAGQAAARGITLGRTGPVLLPDGEMLGRHKGLWQYTEGQRKGLGIAWRAPLYVLAKDRMKNILHVGPREALGMRACRTGAVNFLVPPELWPDKLFVRLRYRQTPSPAQVTFTGTGMDITLPEAQFPTAPGQLAVLYDAEGYVLAGAEIESVQGLHP